MKRREHAARRLVMARANYARDPSSTNLLELERAEARYVAAQNYTKPYYKETKR